MVSLDRAGRSDGEEVGKLLDLLDEQGASAHGPAQPPTSDRIGCTRRSSDLPQPLRDVIHLVYFQDLKYREAAEALRHSGRHGEKPHARRGRQTERSLDN